MEQSTGIERYIVNKRPHSQETLLARARKKQGWTQAFVAQEVAVSVDAVRQWERGRHLPYQATIHKLCELFQMTPEELGLLKAQDVSLARESAEQSYDSARPSLQSADLTWTPNEEEKLAAWEIYVELVTRIPIAPLVDGEGILREALSSLYSLFQTARAILRSYGPAIAQSRLGSDRSLSYLVVCMLNTILRPLLAKWHPLLKAYEETRPVSVGITQYEQQWERYTELRQQITLVRKGLTDYANLFAQIAGVPSLIPDMPEMRPREEAVLQGS
jgi:transcriptional regulator with XRE-family HTH domain